MSVRISARISDVQKLKQKSQSNNLEISFGDLIIISSRIPNLPISKIPNAEVHAIMTVRPITKYNVDIALLLLM